MTEIYNLSSLSITCGSDDNGDVGKYAKVIHQNTEEESCISNNNGGVYYNENNEKLLIGVSNPNITNLIIDNDCTGIFDEAFYENDSIESVIIPEGCKTIGGNAFYNCVNLSSITLPSTLTSIGNNSFACCTSLSSVILPSALTTINSNSFLNCTSLKTLVIPAGVEVIGELAFSGCTNLLSITLPSTIKSIENNAFEKCSKLVEIYNLSNLDISVGSEDNGMVAYYALVVNTSLTVESKIVNSNGGIYFNTESDKLLISILNTNVNSFVIDNDCTIIRDYAFSNSEIVYIIIPEGCKEINRFAFNSCMKLEQVTISSTVNKICSSCFYCCKNLSAIIYNDTEEKWNDIDIETNWNLSAGIKIIHCTDGDIVL